MDTSRTLLHPQNTNQQLKKHNIFIRKIQVTIFSNIALITHPAVLRQKLPILHVLTELHCKAFDHKIIQANLYSKPNMDNNV